MSDEAKHLEAPHPDLDQNEYTFEKFCEKFMPDLIDPINLTVFQSPLAIVPCGHSVDEYDEDGDDRTVDIQDAAGNISGKTIDGCPNCPECRKNIQNLIPNFSVKKLLIQAKKTWEEHAKQLKENKRLSKDAESKDTLRGKITQLQKEKESAEKDNSSLKGKLEKADQQFEDSQKAVTRLQAENAALKLAESKNAADLEAKNNELEEVKEEANNSGVRKFLSHNKLFSATATLSIFAAGAAAALFFIRQTAQINPALNNTTSLAPSPVDHSNSTALQVATTLATMAPQVLRSFYEHVINPTCAEPLPTSPIPVVDSADEMAEAVDEEKLDAESTAQDAPIHTYTIQEQVTLTNQFVQEVNRIQKTGEDAIQQIKEKPWVNENQRNDALREGYLQAISQLIAAKTAVPLPAPENQPSIAYINSRILETQIAALPYMAIGSEERIKTLYWICDFLYKSFAVVSAQQRADYLEELIKHYKSLLPSTNLLHVYLWKAQFENTKQPQTTETRYEIWKTATQFKNLCVQLKKEKNQEFLKFERETGKFEDSLPARFLNDEDGEIKKAAKEAIAKILTKEAVKNKNHADLLLLALQTENPEKILDVTKNLLVLGLDISTVSLLPKNRDSKKPLATNKNGQIPLFYFLAATKYFPGLIEVLTDSLGDNIRMSALQTALMDAIYGGQFENVKTLTHLLPIPIHAIDITNIGGTLLHLAITHPDIVQFLLQNNVAISADKTGKTPLHWAVEKGVEESVRLLLAANQTSEKVLNEVYQLAQKMGMAGKVMANDILACIQKSPSSMCGSTANAFNGVMKLGNSIRETIFGANNAQQNQPAQINLPNEAPDALDAESAAQNAPVDENDSSEQLNADKARVDEMTVEIAKPTAQDVASSDPFIEQLNQEIARIKKTREDAIQGIKETKWDSEDDKNASLAQMHVRTINELLKHRTASFEKIKQSKNHALVEKIAIINFELIENYKAILSYLSPDSKEKTEMFYETLYRMCGLMDTSDSTDPQKVEYVKQLIKHLDPQTHPIRALQAYLWQTKFLYSTQPHTTETRYEIWKAATQFKKLHAQLKKQKHPELSNFENNEGKLEDSLPAHFLNDENGEIKKAAKTAIAKILTRKAVQQKSHAELFVLALKTKSPQEILDVTKNLLALGWDIGESLIPASLAITVPGIPTNLHREISPVNLAASARHVPGLIEILRDSFFVPYLNDENALMSTFYTAVGFAIKLGQLDNVKTLINTGVNPHLMDENGYSLLHYAVWHPDIVEFLLQKNVAISADKDGNTPLHLAVTGGEEKTVKLLLATNKTSEQVLREVYQLAQNMGKKGQIMANDILACIQKSPSSMCASTANAFNGMVKLGSSIRETIFGANNAQRNQPVQVNPPNEAPNNGF